MFALFCQDQQIKLSDLLRDNRERDRRMESYVVALLRGESLLPHLMKSH
jgi:hypothetical protein